MKGKKKFGIFRKLTPDTAFTCLSDRVCYHMPIILWGVRQEFISPHLLSLKVFPFISRRNIGFLNHRVGQRADKLFDLACAEFHLIPIKAKCN